MMSSKDSLFVEVHITAQLFLCSIVDLKTSRFLDFFASCSQILFPQDSTTAFLQTGNCKSLSTTSPPGVIPKYVYFGQAKDEKRIPQFQNCVHAIILHNLKK